MDRVINLLFAIPGNRNSSAINSDSTCFALIADNVDIEGNVQLHFRSTRDEADLSQVKLDTKSSSQQFL